MTPLLLIIEKGAHGMSRSEGTYKIGSDDFLTLLALTEGHSVIDSQQDIISWEGTSKGIYS